MSLCVFRALCIYVCIELVVYLCGYVVRSFVNDVCRSLLGMSLRVSVFSYMSVGLSFCMYVFDRHVCI